MNDNQFDFNEYELRDLLKMRDALRVLDTYCIADTQMLSAVTNAIECKANAQVHLIKRMFR